MSVWPVIVVTGANAGVGFGICRRLVSQLCLSDPPDSWPQPWANPRSSTDPPRIDGLTLILACRSFQRAEAARQELYNQLDAYIARLRARKDYDGHADIFRRNLKIETEYLDLSVLSSVFTFGEHISKRHKYISHLICNAGVANFMRIDWILLAKQFVSSGFLSTITAPEYYVQSTGDVTADGLGFIWQSNLFGHYVLFRVLGPLLRNPAYPADSRIIWSSSLEASSKFYDEDDWQLVKTDHSYEAVKYQIELIAMILDRQALQDSSSRKRIRHFVSHPAICSTKISTNLVAYGGFLDTVKVLVFYVGRFLFGSRHHPITPANSSIAAVHLVLVAITFITFSNSKTSASDDSKSGTEPTPVRFGAETDRWGNPAVGITPVKRWEENKAHGEFLVEKCDQLYREFEARRETGEP